MFKNFINLIYHKENKGEKFIINSRNHKELDWFENSFVSYKNKNS